MSKLDEIRKKLLAQDRTARGNLGQVDNTVYPHWELPTGGQSVIRFLPDGDTDNVFFWVEKQMIRLKFPGIKGEEENKEITIQVPCMEMYNEQCPILTEIRPWFNTDLDDAARSYWKKRSYLFQGFVQDDGLKETEVPENPIRRFVTTPQIFKIIKSALLDPDMEYVPTDYTNGTDFRVIKTQNGQWADWNTSSWARRESALTQDQLDAIDKFGLNNLNDFLPSKPDSNALSAIVEMFEASVNGDLYDPEKWANYYKPFGFSRNEAPKNTDSAPKAQEKITDPTPTPAVKPAETPAKTASSEDEMPDTASDILAKLRQRAASSSS